jgi:hypothetical protein
MKLSYFDLALLFVLARLGGSAPSGAIKTMLREFDNMVPQLIKVHSALGKLKKMNLVLGDLSA